MHTTELPLDIKLMTVATRALVVLLAVLCAGAVVLWALRHPAWTVRAITVQGDVTHQNAVTFRAQLASQMKTTLSGSFLTLDLQQVRQLFEGVPWVRRAVVQREFPNRLKVTIEEHQAVAWWGESGSGRLVNRLGEVFEASPDEGEELPELAGPDHQSAQVWALYQTLQTEFQRLDMGLARLELTERGSWRADLDAMMVWPVTDGSPALSTSASQRSLSWDGRLLRITRTSAGEPAGGLRVVAWTRRPDGQWLRWQSAPFLSQNAWKAAWDNAENWSQTANEQAADGTGAQAVRVANATEWQVHYFRNNAWTNPLSSGAESAAAVGTLPDGVRLLINFAPGQALNGPMVLDWVRPNFGGAS